MFPIDVLRFSEFRTMSYHLSETLMLNDIQITSAADKASINIVFVCKSYYFECIIKELGLNNNTSSNTTYKPTSFDKDEILANHISFMTSLNIPSDKVSEDLPYLYWMPKLYKTPYNKGT
jgi:hypothetical protein